tara:strand:+ start:178 stop:534 length:357 start_codon:yes stop_codon:yes gene_type:complete
MSTLSVGTIKSASSASPVFQNSSGTEKGKLVFAWVNFTTAGSSSINGDFNVTSITENSTSEYTINFANAAANDDYAVIPNANLESNVWAHTLTTGSYKTSTGGGLGTNEIHGIVIADQ